MIIINNETLTTQEVFWHLFLTTMESPSEMLPFFVTSGLEPALLQPLATRVFRSIEERGKYSVYPFDDGFCLSMPQEFDESAKEELRTHLEERTWHTSITSGSLVEVLDNMISVADTLAYDEEEFEPPIKAFLFSVYGIYAVAQGYGQKKLEPPQLAKELKECGYGEAKGSRDNLIKVLKAAIADNHWGDTSIQIHFIP